MNRKYYLVHLIKPFFKVEGRIIHVKEYQLNMPMYFLTSKALSHVYELMNYGYSVQRGF